VSVDFDVEFVGDSPGDIEQRLADVNLEARNRTNRALMQTASEVKEDLEDTAPVDTGEYRDSWYIWSVSYNEVWILNEADHAKFVMLPNQKMMGSSKADLPSQGILHNVKGVARRKQKTLNLNMAQELKRMIKSFRVK